MPKTSMNIEENLVGLLCYLGWFITGIVFIVLEKQNKFVRFHAMQSIIVFLPAFIIEIILWFIPVVGWILCWIFTVLIIILWIILMLKAYMGEKFKLPIVGDIAEKNI